MTKTVSARAARNRSAAASREPARRTESGRLRECREREERTMLRRFGKGRLFSGREL